MKSRVKIISIDLFLSVFITVVSADGQRAGWKEMTEKENAVEDSYIKLEFVGHLGEIDSEVENSVIFDLLL